MAKAFLLVQLLLALSLSFFALSSNGEGVAEAVTTDAVSPVHPPAASPTHHHHPGHHPGHHRHLAPAPTPSAAHAPAPHHHHHAHHHAHAPVPAPMAHPPPHAPVHPPSHAPVHPPAHPPMAPMGRRFIAVQGVVYCKSCKYSGVETLLGATPLLGAVVKLECNNTKYRPTVQTAKTDKNGYFFLIAPKTITTFAFHKCKAFLDSSPLPTCRIPSPLHGGAAGAVLRPEKPVLIDKLPFTVFTVGPFAFEPQCKP